MKLLIHALVTLSIFVGTYAIDPYNIKDLPHPYCTLQVVLPFNNHGFYFNGQWIEKLIQNNQIKNIVEVGSWMGLSTRHMASLLPKDGKLYAIDTWEGSVEHHANPNLVNWLPTLYEQFLSNIVHAGLTDKIIPIRMRSQDAIGVLQSYHDNFDLIYIDAAHDAESVYQDLQAYFPLVKKRHGILCGDDWYLRSVRNAVVAFAQKYQLTIYADRMFWFFAQEGKFQILLLKNVPESVWQLFK